MAMMIDQLPAKAGVYLMKDGKGKVLYIGKAVDLKARVSQYFKPGRDKRVMVPLLVRQVADIETIVVTSEKEALLLENNLIKAHRPKYNVLLKDDKTYVAIKINTRHPWPRLSLVRQSGRAQPDGLYFGPYTSGFAARKTFDLLQRLFPLRQCSDQELLRRKRPCILYDMGRCAAPCVKRCTKEVYDGYVAGAVRFLKGDTKSVVTMLKKEMATAADDLEFERAGECHRLIQQIEQTMEGQHVDRLLGGDIDVVGLWRDADRAVLTLLFYRGGKLSGKRDFFFDDTVQEDGDLIASFLLQHYEGVAERPHEVLVPVPCGEALSDVLSDGQKHRVQVAVPQRGHKKELLSLAGENAKEARRRVGDEETAREKILLEMKEKFHLKRLPVRIECFDNSHSAGKQLVSALVAFTDGQKDSSRYRKYKIKTVGNEDDYGAMQEALRRRYSKGEELPDLVLIDGGRGHLNAALAVFRELDIVSVDVIGVAKDEGRHDKGITVEQIFLPEVKDPVRLSSRSALLFFLQKVRDEAHRCAIGYQRKLASKELVKSALDDIAGIGPAKKRALIQRFGSVRGIAKATLEELQTVEGISERLAQKILAQLASFS